MGTTELTVQRRTANLELVRRFFACFASGDLTALKTAILAPDVRWHVPGRHPLAGTHHGPDEIVAFFGQLSRSGFRAKVLFLEADDDRVVDVHRGWSNRGDGHDIDLLWSLVFRIEAGRVVE